MAYVRFVLANGEKEKTLNSRISASAFITFTIKNTLKKYIYRLLKLTQQKTEFIMT